MKNGSINRCCILAVVLAVSTVLFASCQKKQQDKEALSVSEEFKGTIYGTAQELIYDALQSTEYGDKANTVAGNYARFMKGAIEYVMPFNPVTASIVPFQSFLDFTDPPAFSICLSNEKGQKLVLSLQEPLYPGSAGTVQFEDTPISARSRFDVNTSDKEYKKREESYMERLKESGIGNRIAAEIKASDWELDSSDSVNMIDHYLELLASLYAFEQVKYLPIKEITLIIPEERMLHGENREPYGVRFIDEEENVIIIYAEARGRPLFDSVIINGALIRYCIYRL